MGSQETRRNLTECRYNTRDDEGAKSPARSSLSVLELLGSGCAAALGVQSGKNRARDFTRGSASTFIALGIVFTAIFIGGLLTIVRLVLLGQ